MPFFSKKNASKLKIAYLVFESIIPKLLGAINFAQFGWQTKKLELFEVSWVGQKSKLQWQFSPVLRQFGNLFTLQMNFWCLCQQHTRFVAKFMRSLYFVICLVQNSSEGPMILKGFQHYFVKSQKSIWYPQGVSKYSKNTLID